MAFLRSKNTAKPDFTALDIQTSASTLPIPIVYGRTKIGANVIFYGGFRVAPGSTRGKGVGGKGGGGKGGGGAAQSYTYYADILMGLCEGPIQGVGLVYKNQSLYVLLELDLGLYTGTTPQTPNAYFVSRYPAQTLAYQGTAYVWAPNYNLGDTATVGNHNFEVIGILAGTGVNGIDADPAQVIYDFLTNAQYGAGYSAASISSTALFGAGGDASLQSYCRTMGIAFSPKIESQEPASSILTRWLKLLNCAAVWSGGLLKFIPYGDTAIAQGAQTAYSTTFSIPTPTPLSNGGIPAFVQVCTPAQFVSDGGVIYTETGGAFAFIGAQIPTAPFTYGMVTPGTYIFGVADEGKPVTVTFTAQALGGYSPNLTPVYALTDNNFVADGSKDPVEVERADIYSLPTIQRLEALSRSNQYAALPVEARDQASIEIFGPRVGPVIAANEICDEAIVAPIVAQTILQRELYVRTKFTFKLSWEFCLLDPMDVVTLTDSNLGLSNYPVRVISIEEDDRGLLTVTAEELVAGVSTGQFYPSGSTAGAFSQNTAVPAVPVNTPLIFEPPLAATGGVAQIWVGGSGAGGTVAQWGGANVWVSLEGTTYSQVATITAPLRQGFLTAALPLAAGWDPTDTLSVNLAESQGALAGTSQAAAQQGATLSLVESELLAYQTATLVSGNAYNLTGLARGLCGTTPSASHASGAPFARLDGAVVQYDLPAGLAGKTLYFKFQSFNAFGGGEQDLSTCAVYAFTAPVVSSSGGAPPYPIATQLRAGIPLDLGQVISVPTLADDWGLITAAVTDTTDLGSIPVASHPIATALLSGNVDLGAIVSLVTVSDDFGGVANDGAAQTITLGTVP
ncbi:MAG: phage tail protein [Sphingomonadaceae bacterium]|nr:phage tail protein [Sphingomonadaceae bacterium]